MARILNFTYTMQPDKKQQHIYIQGHVGSACSIFYWQMLTLYKQPTPYAPRRTSKPLNTHVSLMARYEIEWEEMLRHYLDSRWNLSLEKGFEGCGVILHGVGGGFQLTSFSCFLKFQVAVERCYDRLERFQIARGLRPGGTGSVCSAVRKADARKGDWAGFILGGWERSCLRCVMSKQLCKLVAGISPRALTGWTWIFGNLIFHQTANCPPKLKGIGEGKKKNFPCISSKVLEGKFG